VKDDGGAADGFCSYVIFVRMDYLPLNQKHHYHHEEATMALNAQAMAQGCWPVEVAETFCYFLKMM